MAGKSKGFGKDPLSKANQAAAKALQAKLDAAASSSDDKSVEPGAALNPAPPAEGSGAPEPVAGSAVKSSESTSPPETTGPDAAVFDTGNDASTLSGAGPMSVAGVVANSTATSSGTPLPARVDDTTRAALERSDERAAVVPSSGSGGGGIRGVERTTFERKDGRGYPRWWLIAPTRRRSLD